MNWTQDSAIELCTEIEAWCPKFGCHVALTGGCLYGDVSPSNDRWKEPAGRKDLDILFYRIRQCPFIDVKGIEKLLTSLGWTKKSNHAWVQKWEDNKGRKVDIFFPENTEGYYYPEDEPNDKKR